LDHFVIREEVINTPLQGGHEGLLLKFTHPLPPLKRGKVTIGTIII